MYDVTQIEDFAKQIAALKTKYERIDELYQAIVWYLEKNPTSDEFERLDGNDFLWRTGRLIDDLFPQLLILFRVNEQKNEVILLALREI